MNCGNANGAGLANAIGVKENGVRITLTDGTNVHVRFDHGQRREKPRRRERHPGRFTQCTVSFEGGDDRFVGVAKAHTVLDNFCKRVGRRLALARALAPLPRGIREEIWDNYHMKTVFDA